MDTQTNNIYLGVEIGGTKQQVCIGTGDGTILERWSVRLGFVTADKILEWIEETIRPLINKYEISGIGVGFGGPLESRSGRVLASLQVDGWRDFRLKDWFSERFDLPVIVANDTFTGGLGELNCGSGKGAKLLFYTNIGTGIGGGLYINGKGFDGSGFGAVYLGNTWVPDWTAGTGSYTRMELICSGKSIAQRLQTQGYVPADSVLAKQDRNELTAQQLGNAVRVGDPFACAELDRITESFSLALANMLASTGASLVVIGGGVAKMGEILFSQIRKKTAQFAFEANKGRYEILPGKLGDDAVLTGALILAQRQDRVYL